MGRQTRKAIGLALIVIAAVLFLIWIPVSPGFNQCVAKASDKKNEQSTKKQPSVMSSFGTYMDCFGEGLDKGSGAITALATVVIAGLTVFLWLSTHKMWEEANAARELALKEFSESHFPRIEVRRVRLRYDAKNHGILYVIANVGTATATKIVGNLNCWLGHPDAVNHQLKRECMPPYGDSSVDISAAIDRPDLAGRPELLPRQRTFHFLHVPELNADWMGRFINGKATIVFYGYIDFSDASGERRGMGFFRTYREGRFWPEENDPDYEWN